MKFLGKLPLGTIKRNHPTMTKVITTSLFLLFMNCNSLAQSTQNVKAVLDSLEVLKGVNGFMFGFPNSPTPEETRYFNITRMLFSLPFSETRKLMHDGNKFARAYGFTVASKKYFDSLTKSDKRIFKDTAKLSFYSQRGVIDSKITLGQYCKMAYTSAIEDHKNQAKYFKINSSIQSYIKENAMFPDSYESNEFLNYSFSEWEDEKSYEVLHKYWIKDNTGKIDMVQDYFILDKYFKVVIIERIRSKVISADRPLTEEWLKAYGKN